MKSSVAQEKKQVKLPWQSFKDPG